MRVQDGLKHECRNLCLLKVPRIRPGCSRPSDRTCNISRAGKKSTEKPAALHPSLRIAMGPATVAATPAGMQDDGAVTAGAAAVSRECFRVFLPLPQPGAGHHLLYIQFIVPVFFIAFLSRNPLVHTVIPRSTVMAPRISTSNPRIPAGLVTSRTVIAREMIPIAIRL